MEAPAETAGIVGGTPPPLPPRPLGRGAALLRQLSLPLHLMRGSLDGDDEEAQEGHEAYAAFEFCPVFAVPTLEEVVKEAQEEEEEIPAFLKIDVHLSTMGEKLDHVLDLVGDPRQLLTETATATSAAARGLAGLVKRSTGGQQGAGAAGGGGAGAGAGNGRHAAGRGDVEDGSGKAHAQPHAPAPLQRGMSMPAPRLSSELAAGVAGSAGVAAAGHHDVPAAAAHARPPSPQVPAGWGAEAAGVVGVEDVTIGVRRLGSTGGGSGQPVRRPSAGASRGAALLQQAASPPLGDRPPSPAA